MLTVLAALFVPIVGGLVYVGFWTINSLLRTCTERTYSFSTYSRGETYTVCTNPGSAWIIPLLIIAPFLVLLYLYARVKIKNPARRAALVTALIAVAFVAEFVGGAALILTGVGGFVYLILVPIMIGWISVWYHRHIGREFSAENTVPINQINYPPPVQTTENHDQEPPEPIPPTSIAQ